MILSHYKIHICPNLMRKMLGTFIIHSYRYTAVENLIYNSFVEECDMEDFSRYKKHN